MNGIERMIDANLNRAAEGFRVLEDITRFCMNNRALTETLKALRHKARKCVQDANLSFLAYRDSEGDIGPSVSSTLNLEGKKDVRELVTANFKRVQEALRSLEESLRILGKDSLSREFEAIRYSSYTIEKEFDTSLTLTDKSGILDSAGIYCITSEEHSLGRDNIEVVSKMLKAGIKLIQYREKSKSMLEKYRQCIRLREMTADAGAVFIINDHIDLAKSIGADGVHLGQDDMPVPIARQLAGKEMLLGASTHSPEQAERAIAEGADYIGVGPIYRTYTKKDVCDPVGLQYLDYAVKNVAIPFVAIGGIKLHNMHEVTSKGARCISLVTEIVGAEDIEGTIANIRKSMKGDI